MDALYLCHHPGNILTAIIHKIKFHFSDNAVLILIPEPRDDYNTSPFIPVIPRFEFHYDCITTNEVRVFLMKNSYSDLCEFSNDLCTKVFKKCNISPENYTTYFIFDWLPLFSLYYHDHRIDYSVIISNNQSGLVWNAFHPFSGKHYNAFLLNEKFKFAGVDSEHCKNVYCPGNLNYQMSSEKSIIIFDFIETLVNLDEDIRRQLEAVYRINYLYDLQDIENFSIILLNSLNYYQYNENKYNLGKFLCSNSTLENFLNFNLLIADFFCPNDKIMVKPHPTFSSKAISFFSSKCSLLPSDVPFEIFACNKVFAKKLNLFCPLTSASSSIANLFCNNTVSLGERVIPFFLQIPFIYSTITFLTDTISINTPINLFVHDIDVSLLNMFLEKNFSKSKFNIHHLNKSNINTADIIVANTINSDFRQYTPFLKDNSILFANVNNFACADLIEIDSYLFSTTELNNLVTPQQIFIKTLRPDIINRANSFICFHNLSLSNATIQTISLHALYLIQLYPVISLYQLNSQFSAINFYAKFFHKKYTSPCVDYFVKNNYFKDFSNIRLFYGEWSSSEGSINIASYPYFACRDSNDKFKGEMLLLDKVRNQNWNNSITFMFNINLEYWKSNSVINNSKLNSYGILVTCLINFNNHSFEAYSVVYCKDKNLMTKIKNQISLLSFSIHPNCIISYKTQFLASSVVNVGG